MNNKSLTIATLTITAVILAVANLIPFPQQNALAAETIKDRDYHLVTSRVQQGGEGLYILDNRTGKVAVFTWDVASRSVRLRAVRMVTDAFPQ